MSSMCLKPNQATRALDGSTATGCSCRPELLSGLLERGETLKRVQISPGVDSPSFFPTKGSVFPGFSEVF